MRTIVAAAVVVGLSSGSALSSDPFNGHGWQRSRPPAAVAYFKMPFHASKEDGKVAYGLAVTAPTPRRYSSAPVLIGDTPKLLDLRFEGALPHTLNLSEQVVWSLRGATQYGGEQRHLLGVPGLGGLVLGAALTAGAVYGLYTVVKKECPAISTTTGGCVKNAN